MATIPSFNRFQPSSHARGFGSSAWAIRTISPRPVPSQTPVATAAILRSLAKEPEDAGLTGGTRSLDRRLLALNFGVSVNKIEAVTQRVGEPWRSAAA
jgi:hypothetical protein